MPKPDVEAAVSEYFARIHRAALMLTGSPWDADDLAQETFLVLSRKGHTFNGRSSLYTWLYGVMLNLERRNRRRQGVKKRKLRVLWEDAPLDEESHPAAETRLEVAEWKHSLWSRVARLPDDQRQAIVLRFSEGMSYDEIAETVGCPQGTAKSRVFYGLAALRQIMAAESDEKGEEIRQPPDHPDEDISHVV